MATRRVWVRRPHGVATTITVSPDDIVDDLKSALIRKYSIALGRIHDAPDLIIKMAGSSSSHSSSHGHRRKRNEAVRRELSFIESGHQNNQAHGHSHSHSHGHSHSHNHNHNQATASSKDDDGVILPPDVNVFAVLDKNFPDGMTMQDAFVVDVLDYNAVDDAASDDDYDHSKLSSTPPHSSAHSSPAPSETRSSSRRSHHSDDDVHSQRASSVEPFLSHNSSTSTSSVHNHALRKQVTASQSGGSVNVSDTQVSTTSSAIQVSHAVSSRPQPQPLQQTTESHRTPSNSSLDDESSTRTQSPHPRSTHGHSFAGAHTSTTVTNTKAQVQTLTQKATLQTTPTETETTNDQQEGEQILQVETVDVEKSEATMVSDSTEAVGSNPAGTSSLKTKSVSASRPAKDKQPQQSYNTSSLLDGIVPPIKVLIVEDNIINQRILETFMRRRRIRSNVAKNGKEAVEKWREGGYHLVLMDIQLPVLSGIEATKEIRRLERRNRIGVFVDQDSTNIKDEDVLPPHRFKSPVIIVALTASSLDSDRKEALAAGCNDFLIKPVNLVWLERKITEWGCMQALIDFEGWRQWKGTDEAEKDSNGNGGSFSRQPRRLKQTVARAK
ncbi:hypothetical protein BZA70DRAFT_286057 [Myxozyma melibiosi]|uniref:Response regulatory domain-containing protein n=1 Tax=Myxozyma melibiosi TaxID=54550 RepID=A0ABR1EXQ2_9ASCO